MHVLFTRTDTKTVKVDLTFVFDAASVTSANWELLKDFAKNIVFKLRIDTSNGAKVAAVRYGSSASVVFNLNRYSTQDALWQGITNIQTMSGSRNTADAFRVVREQIYTSANGDRSDAPNMVILFTSGSSSDVNAAQQQANLLKQSGATVMVVAIGANANANEARAIATSSSMISFVEQYSGLTALVDSSVTKISTAVPPVDGGGDGGGGGSGKRRQAPPLTTLFFKLIFVCKPDRFFFQLEFHEHDLIFAKFACSFQVFN